VENIKDDMVVTIKHSLLKTVTRNTCMQKLMAIAVTDTYISDLVGRNTFTSVYGLLTLFVPRFFHVDMTGGSKLNLTNNFTVV
jgi:hypothetical protein